MGREGQFEFERRRQGLFDPGQGFGVEPLGGQGIEIDRRAPLEGSAADGEVDDLGNLLVVVAQTDEGRRNRLIDNLEVAAAGEFLELDQGEVRFDARRIAVHHQTDRSGRRQNRRLGVSETVLFAPLQRTVPRLACSGQQIRRCRFG